MLHFGQIFATLYEAAELDAGVMLGFILDALIALHRLHIPAASGVSKRRAAGPISVSKLYGSHNNSMSTVQSRCQQSFPYVVYDILQQHNIAFVLKNIVTAEINRI